MAVWVTTVHGDLINLDQMRSIQVREATSPDASQSQRWDIGAWITKAKPNSDSFGYVIDVSHSKVDAYQSLGEMMRELERATRGATTMRVTA